MKKLPIGIQTFSEIINDNYLYVDKTKEIFNLITMGKYIFMSRPRRFGKSLLVTTLKEIFLGNKELFNGLYIYDKIAWKTYPVIHIDFSMISHSDSETLKSSLSFFIEQTGQNYNIKFSSKFIGDKFKELILEINKKTGNKVVILIDEYDKPIIDHITDKEKAGKNRDILKEFYAILKGSDEYIKFVFLTGVSKFSKVSIFSGLNNLQDLTLDSRFPTLPGITEKELKKYFPEYIKKLQKKEKIVKREVFQAIKHWYNGYSWDGVNRVYNPHSILNLFSSLKFSNYWFSTGTPGFLINIIKEMKAEVHEFENKQITEILLDSYDIDSMNLYSLLFQTGYLTIRDVSKEEEFITYTLRYPNLEVKSSLITYIIECFTENRLDEIQPAVIELKKSLRRGNIEGFIKIIRVLFAKIPYTLHIEKEAYYHSLFYMILALMGVDLDLEVLTDKGRVDGVLEINDKIYVIEFKYGVSGTDIDKLLQGAISQISEKRYYEKYIEKDKEIIFLGVGFVDKNIEYKIENYNT